MPNTTDPPPAPLAAQIAFCMAAVSSVCPSPLAPNEFTDAPTHTARATVPELAQTIHKRTIAIPVFTVILLSSAVLDLASRTALLLHCDRRGGMLQDSRYIRTGDGNGVRSSRKAISVFLCAVHLLYLTGP